MTVDVMDAGSIRTIAAARRAAAARLAAAGMDVPLLEADILLCTVLKTDRTGLLRLSRAALDESQVRALMRLVRRRCTGEPVAYLTGRREFRSLDFDIRPPVLIPRPDSETLIDGASRLLTDLDFRQNAPIRILDLGTGSGCLAIALLSEWPNAVAVATDKSRAALALVRANARRHGVARRLGVIRDDWKNWRRRGVDHLTGQGRFDLVVSNPPYIPAASIPHLQRDVRKFESALALDGGKDGLDAYRSMAPHLAALLAPEGAVIVEIGVGQAATVRAILGAAGLQRMESFYDLNGIERCIGGVFC